MKNTNIRTAALSSGVRLWEVSERLGMHDSNFSRLLRHELDKDTKDKIMSAIAEIREDKKKE